MAKEHPILFTGAMVRAILDGTKTQTRRVMKPQPKHHNACNGGWLEYRGQHLSYPYGPHARHRDTRNSFIYARWSELCPLGQPGDTLWVREAWCEVDRDGWCYCDRPKDELITNLGYPRRNGVAYRANTDADADRCRRELGYKWRPSIYMPRWASRIALPVANIRVQRVQDISEEDAMAEGILPFDRPRCEFRKLWDSINAKRGFGWEVNPWVWAITFRKIEVATP